MKNKEIKEKDVVITSCFLSTLRNYFAKGFLKITLVPLVELVVELKQKIDFTSEVELCQTRLNS